MSVKLQLSVLSLRLTRRLAIMDMVIISMPTWQDALSAHIGDGTMLDLIIIVVVLNCMSEPQLMTYIYMYDILFPKTSLLVLIKQ